MQVCLGIDVGKTSIRIGVFSPDLTLLDGWRIPSGDVREAIAELCDRSGSLDRRFTVEAAGISTFGPLNTEFTSPNYGMIHESSDPAWSGINLPALVSSVLGGKPVFFDYDVNAGALAEATVGAAQHAQAFVYLSVGTGVGGVVYRGSLTPGYAPQLGHMYLPREADDQEFRGSCRFHGGCLQGLASGKALLERWGTRGEALEAEHPAWDLEARYLARACVNLIYTFSPQKIVIGSSVGLAGNLIDRINSRLPSLLNGFLEPELQLLFARDSPVVSAGLTPDSSLIGAGILARDGLGLRFPPGPGRSNPHFQLVQSAIHDR